MEFKLGVVLEPFRGSVGFVLVLSGVGVCFPSGNAFDSKSNVQPEQKHPSSQARRESPPYIVFQSRLEVHVYQLCMVTSSPCPWTGIVSTCLLALIL